MPSIADLEYAYLGDQGATGTLLDRRAQIYGVEEWAYFAARSGLTPANFYSLHDHELAYYRGLAGISSGSLADAQRIAWTPQPPQITVQPSTAPQTVKINHTLELSAAASGVPAPSVQWQRSNDGGTTWAPVPGATSPNLSHTIDNPPYVTDQTWLFRAVFTNGSGTVNSAASGVITIGTVAAD